MRKKILGSDEGTSSRKTKQKAQRSGNIKTCYKRCIVEGSTSHPRVFSVCLGCKVVDADYSILIDLIGPESPRRQALGMSVGKLNWVN